MANFLSLDTKVEARQVLHPQKAIGKSLEVKEEGNRIRLLSGLTGRTGLTGRSRFSAKLVNARRLRC